MRPSGRQVPSCSILQGERRRTSLPGQRRWIALPHVDSLTNMPARSGLTPTRHRWGQEGQRRRPIA
jgi:hypothetical protein